MHAPRLSDERGIALAMAVFALVIIGVLVAGAFFSGRLEQRGGVNSVMATEAFEAAEGGLAYTINDGWQTSTFNALAVGASSVQPPASAQQPAWCGVRQAGQVVTRSSAARSLQYGQTASPPAGPITTGPRSTVGSSWHRSRSRSSHGRYEMSASPKARPVRNGVAARSASSASSSALSRPSAPGPPRRRA